MSDPITMLSLPADDQRPRVITAESSMESLQALIGGCFECQGDDDLSIWSDEEAKLKGLPVNAAATAIGHRERLLSWWDVYCGPVLITGGADDEGRTQGLGDHPRHLELIRRLGQ